MAKGAKTERKRVMGWETERGKESNWGIGRKSDRVWGRKSDRHGGESKRWVDRMWGRRGRFILFIFISWRWEKTKGRMLPPCKFLPTRAVLIHWPQL